MSRLRTGIAVAPAQRTPSSAYMGLWTCFQAAADTTLKDSSGKGAHSNALWSASEAWTTNPGWFSSLNASGKYATIPIAKWPHRFATDALLIFGISDVTPEGSAASLFGNSTGTTNTGFRVRCWTAGELQPYLDRTDGAQSTGVTTATAFVAGTPASWAVAYDPLTARMYAYINGVVDVAYASGKAVTTPELIDAGTWLDVGIGGRAAADTMAGRHKCIHALYRAGKGLPANIDAVVARLHKNPILPLSETEFPA